MGVVSVIEGSGFTSADPRTVRHIPKSLFLIDEKGYIEDVVGEGTDAYGSLKRFARGKGMYSRLARGQFLLPGFVDLHVHAPQWVQTGTGLDEPLDVWLDTYTFHSEARFADLEFADRVYTDLVGRLLALGTTTAVYYATIHRPASVLLARIAADSGQRALVGKLTMDSREQNPSYYREPSTSKAIDDAEAFIDEVTQLGRNTLQGVFPVVSPRFLPSCTDEALKGLGRLAARYDAYIQTHCSEGDWEHRYAFDRFGLSDTEVLDRFGLLTPRSILGHCVHLDSHDIELFADMGAIVSHCPHSNAFFASAVAPIRKYLGRGLQVGLGSDISGGFSPSLYDTIRQAVISSKMLEYGVDASRQGGDRGVADSALSFNEAFYLGTAGGGEALGLPIGKLEPGYAWDAQLVDVRRSGARLPIFDRDERTSDIFQKIITLSTPRNIRKVWTQGRLVYAD